MEIKQIFQYGLEVQSIKSKDKDLKEINDLIPVICLRLQIMEFKISQQNVNMYVVVANQKEIKDLIREIGLNRPEFDRIPE